jgi:tryptophan 2,3-dioxygenase
MNHPPVYYGDYLQVERLLSLQSPESAKHGTPVHDEMLFIIVHQAYELWFKQVLHEFDRIERDFSTNPVDDEAMARIVHSLARIHEILKLLVAQLDVLETMTPADFLDFRDYLFPASGFQSLQFRLIETRLGLQESSRVQLDGEAVEKRLSVADRQKLAATFGSPAHPSWIGAENPSGWPIEGRWCGTLRQTLRRSRLTLRLRPSVGSGRSAVWTKPSRRSQQSSSRT